MGIFDDKEIKARMKFFEDERTQLWKRVVAIEANNKLLKSEILVSASESAKDASLSSKKAAEFRNKTEQRLLEAVEKVGELNAKLQEANRTLDGINSINDSILALKVRADTIDSEYEENYEILNNKIEHLSEFIDEYPQLDDKLLEITNFVSDVEANVNKSKTGLNIVNSRRKEIEEFHQELFGYNDTNADDEEIRIDGLKQQLEEGFGELSVNIKKAEDRVTKVKGEYENNFKTFEESYKSNYEQINNEISSLLPAALTAGLSSAFSAKKIQEEANSVSLQKRFSNGIYLLIIASIIPFIVSLVLLLKGEDFDKVILKIPRLVIAIIPMYIPILWFTYSANKKLNLSKRLIEEYAHKEVLSKTYEGLSKQINNLENDEQTKELKYRLLSNFLQVTSENPGKLISNYESSDHPVMEALEQSYKFQIAMDKLENVPGLGKIAARFEANSKKKLIEKEEKIDKVLRTELDQESI